MDYKIKGKESTIEIVQGKTMEILKNLKEKATRGMAILKGKARSICNVAEKDESGSSEIIVIVVLCAVAVAVCLIFKDSLSSLVNSVVTSVETKINGMLS